MKGQHIADVDYMIENYLDKVNSNGWFGELDVADLPKTIEKIMA